MVKLSIDSIILYRKKSYVFCYKLWELIRMKRFFTVFKFVILYKLLVTFLSFLLKFLSTETICLIKCFNFFQKLHMPLFFLSYWMGGHSLIYRINRRSLPGFKEMALNISPLVFLYTCIWSASIAFITSKLIFKILLFFINHERLLNGCLYLQQ